MSSHQIFSVVIPPNGRPGAKVNVQISDGRIFEIVVPTDCVPGNVINVSIPNDASESAAIGSAPKEYSAGILFCLLIILKYT